MRGHRGMLARQILARRNDRKTKASYGPELRPVELALSLSVEREPAPSGRCPEICIKMPFVSIGRPSNAHSCRLKYFEGRTRLGHRSSAGRGSFDEILFNFGATDDMVIRVLGREIFIPMQCFLFFFLFLFRGVRRRDVKGRRKGANERLPMGVESIIGC